MIMARPTKQGIDYFPLDCQFDDKIEMYLIEKGAVGLGVLISIWQMIYSNEGYYIKDSKDIHLLIKRKIDVDINEVSDCINVCLERNVFDEGKYKKHNILTSKAMQKRYFEAAKKKKSVQVDVDYLINGIDSYDNWVYSGGNAANVKEEVKVKEKVKEYEKISGLNIIAFEEFIKFRSELKKKLTESGLIKSAKQLSSFGSIEKQQAIVDKSIANGWQGLFDIDVKDIQQHKPARKSL